MTTLAEIDVVINAKLDPLLSAGKKAENIIRDLDKKLNALSSKTYAPKVSVQADTKRLDEVIKKLGQISNKSINVNTKPASDSVNSLRSSVAGIATTVGAGFGVKEIQEYADAWTMAGNKIKSAAEGAGVQTRSLSELNKLAYESRAGLEETVDLYAKLIRSASGVAKSENEIALATSTITKAMKASGASVQEQKSAILQLGQALGSGVLQGDELRSIRENSPILARAIAKEFGTTVAGLKKLGSEGKLVSDRVFKAILKAAPEISKQFAATIPTIADSFTLVKNSLTEFIGKLNESKGIGAAVGVVMGALAGNIDSVAAAAAAAAVVLLLPGAIGAATALLNPWVLLAAAVGVAAYAVTDFWNEIVPLQGSFATLGDYATASWQLIQEGAISAKESIVNLFSGLADTIAGAMSGVGTSFQNIYTMASDVVNQTVQVFVNLKDTIALAFSQLPAAIANGVVSAMNYMVGVVEAGINKVIAGVNNAINAINTVAGALGASGVSNISEVTLPKLTDAYAGAAEDAAKQFGEIWSRKTEDYVGKAGQAVGQFIGDSGKTITDAVTSAQTAITQKANEAAAARQEMARETARVNAMSGNKSSTGAGSTSGYGGGIPSSASGGSGGSGKKAKKTDYEKETQSIKDKTAALVAETAAQAQLNPLVDDYGYAATRAKTAQELLTAAQKTGIAAGKELKDVSQLLSGNFDGLSPKAREQAQAMLDLATKYAQATSASEQLKERQERLQKSMSDTRELGKSVMSGFISDLQEGKSASEALSNALQKIADKLMDIGLDALFGTGSFSKSGGVFGSLFSGLGSLLSFDGGGTTGSGSRSGGVDGKGGFPAILHPNETVIDHTKTPGSVSIPKSLAKPSVGGAGSTAVTVTLNSQTDPSVITEVVDTQIKSRAPAIVKASVQQSQKQTQQNMPGYLANAQTRSL